MEKLSIILKAVSCASVLLTGSSVIYNVSHTTVEATVEQSAEESINPNIIVTDNGHGTTTVETLPGDSHYVDTAESETMVPEPAEVAPTTPNMPAEPVVSTPVYSTPKTYRYSNHLDFYRDYAGWCPQDVPADAFHLPLPKYVALGYTDFHSNYKTFEEGALYAYNLASDSFGGQPLYVYIQSLLDIEESSKLRAFVLDVTPGSMSVTWRYMGNAPTYSQDLVEPLNSLAARFQARLLQLDQQYYTKCGY